ncbi:hypothetical protein TNCV_4598411 [Trichonephila clavipes]|nr:hypothetical protein TNCV_4598411 [Trichonephila clavipes]
MKRMETRATLTKVARVHQTLRVFCVRQLWSDTNNRVLSISTTAAQENQRLCSENTMYNVSGFIYCMDRIRLSERCPVPIDSDKRPSTVLKYE